MKTLEPVSKMVNEAKMTNRPKVEAADRKEAQTALLAVEQAFDRERRDWADLAFAAVNPFLRLALR